MQDRKDTENTERSLLLSKIEKLRTDYSESDSFLESPLPPEIERLKLVFRRHSFPNEKKADTYFRIVGFFTKEMEVSDFVFKTEDKILIDKRNGIGNFRMIPSGDGFNATLNPDTKGEKAIPGNGLYALSMKLKNGTEFNAEFFILETLPTATPEVVYPTPTSGIAVGNPVIKWKPFYPQDTKKYFKRETFVSFHSEKSEFKDSLWERMVSQSSDPAKQITSLQIKVEKEKGDLLGEHGLETKEKYTFLTTQLEENYLSPRFFISRESTVEFPVETP